jgi:hypothetical protein
METSETFSTVPSPRPADRDKARHVLMDIIAEDGGEVHGKVRLSKAFYFAHLYYWRDNPGTLTDYPIVRLAHGPGVHRIDDLLAAMEKDGLIEIRQEPSGPYLENVYRLAGHSPLDTPSPAHQAVVAAVSYIRDKTGSDLSEVTHERSRSWQRGRDGDVLNIYVDTLSDTDFNSLQSGLASAEEMVNSVFG